MAERLDSVERRVRSIVLTEAARAYGFRASRGDEEQPPTCPSCDGDGCEDCGFTGEMSS